MARTKPQATAARKPGPDPLLTADRLDEVCQLIQEGRSQREIAAALGVSQPTLNAWMTADSDRSARVRDAQRLGAAAWLDRGLHELTEASDIIGVQRARAIEQHCARRAALMDPERFADRSKVEHSGPGGGAIPVAVIERRIVDPTAK